MLFLVFPFIFDRVTGSTRIRCVNSSQFFSYSIVMFNHAVLILVYLSSIMAFCSQQPCFHLSLSLSPVPNSYSLILMIVVGSRLELFDLYKWSMIARKSTLEHCQCQLIDYFALSDDFVSQLFFYYTSPFYHDCLTTSTILTWNSSFAHVAFGQSRPSM
jgi:hypothetical protein